MGHPAVDAAGDLADEVTVGIRVVGVARPGLPPRRGRRDRLRHPRPRPEVVVGEQLVHRRGRRRGGRARGGRSHRPSRRPRTLATPTRSGRRARCDRRPRDAAPTAPPAPCRPSRSRRACRASRAGCGPCRDQPPTRSTTTSPSRITHTAAPTSPCAAKFATNASRTGANAGSQSPEIGTSTGGVSHTGIRPAPADDALVRRRPRICRAMTDERPTAERTVPSVRACSGGCLRVARWRSSPWSAWSSSRRRCRRSAGHLRRRRSDHRRPRCAARRRAARTDRHDRRGGDRRCGRARHRDPGGAARLPRSLVVHDVRAHPERPPCESVGAHPRRTSGATRTSASSRGAGATRRRSTAPGSRCSRPPSRGSPGQATTAVRMLFTATFAGAAAGRRVDRVPPHRPNRRHRARPPAPGDRARHRRRRTQRRAGRARAPRRHRPRRRRSPGRGRARRGRGDAREAHGRDRHPRPGRVVRSRTGAGAPPPPSWGPAAALVGLAYLPLGTSGLSAFVHNRGSLSRASAWQLPRLLTGLDHRHTPIRLGLPVSDTQLLVSVGVRS